MLQNVRAQVKWKETEAHIRVRHVRSAMFMAFLWIASKYGLFQSQAQKISDFAALEYAELY